MISSLEIENFRGIRAGKLDGLTGLTILTGPNGCGKSAVLDALLIGTSPDTGDAIGRAVRRHPETWNGARWLVRGGDAGASARIKTVASGANVEFNLHWQPCTLTQDVAYFNERGHPEPVVNLYFDMKRPDGSGQSSQVQFAADNDYVKYGYESPKLFSFVRFIDPAIAKPLTESHSEVTRRGHRDQVEGFLSQLTGQDGHLEILDSGRGKFELYLGRIPLGLAGDGIQAAMHIALELFAVPKDALVLIEEPEVRQHPKSIAQTAKAIVINAKRGVQTVFSTHSLELIDSIIAAAQEHALLEELAIFNLALRDGELLKGRHQGEQVRFARQEIDADVR